MNSDTAVFDAGPLITFHQIDRLELLCGLFGRVVVPPAVAQEVAPSVGNLPQWIEVHPVFAVPRFSRRLGLGSERRLR